MTTEPAPSRSARRLTAASFVTALGVGIVVALVRLRVVTFVDDFTGMNAVGFVVTWSGALALLGLVLGLLALRAAPQSWAARIAAGIHFLLLLGAGLLLSGWA